MADEVGIIKGKHRQLDNATVWDDIQGGAFTAVTITGPGIQDPDWAKVTDDGAGSDGVYCYKFSPTITETLFMQAQISHSWKLGTNLRPHVHWFGDTADTGNVTWEMEYTVIPFGSTIGTTTVMTVTQAVDAVNKHQVAAFAEIDMSGINSVSAIILFRLARRQDLDTYTHDAGLLYVDFHYQRDDMGSAEEYVKG